MSNISLSVQRVRKGGFWAIVGKVVAVAFGFSVSALLARLLDIDDLGLYFLAFSVVSAGVILGQIGLDRTAVRQIAAAVGVGENEHCTAIVRTVLKWGVFSSLFVAVAFYFLVGEWLFVEVLNANVLASSIFWLALWVIFLVLESLVANIFRGFHDIKWAVSFSGAIRSGILTLALFFLWVMPFGNVNLHDIFILSVCSGGISALVGLFCLRRKISQYGDGRNYVPDKLIRSSLPMMVYAAMLYVVAQSNIWILGGFATKEDVALYGVAMRLVLLVGVSTSIVNAVIPPLISEKYAQGELKSIEPLIRVATTLCGLPAIAVLLIYIFGANWVLETVYGSPYKEASLVLIVLSFGELIKVLTGPCSIALNMTGHQVKLMKLGMARALASIVLSLIVVGEHGILGVAGVYMVCLVLSDAVSLSLAKKHLGVWTIAGVKGMNQVIAAKV